MGCVCCVLQAHLPEPSVPEKVQCELQRRITETHLSGVFVTSSRSKKLTSGVLRHGPHEVVTDGLDTGKHLFFHRKVEEV